MKRNLTWKAALAAVLAGTALSAPLETQAQDTGYVNGYAQNGTNNSNQGAYSTYNGWAYSNYQSNTYWDINYGWVTKEFDGTYWRYYTYGYQVVYVWTNNGYVERRFWGSPGLAYQVIYGPRP